MVGKHCFSELFIAVALMSLQRNSVFAVQQKLLRRIEIFDVGVSCELVEEFCSPLDHLECLGVNHRRPNIPKAFHFIDNIKPALHLLLHLLQRLRIEERPED